MKTAIKTLEEAIHSLEIELRVWAEEPETLRKIKLEIIDHEKALKKLKPKPKELVLFDDPNKLVLFSNSKLSEFEFFEKQFSQPEFQEIDLNYYFNVVSDWSDQANKKRTLKGWIATARNFMRRDFESKKLKMKNQVKAGIDQDLIDYLKM